MPASKKVHVLAILRENLQLTQAELAELAGCSIATIQSIELLRLKLSKSLAAKISVQTGADLDWLLNNDVNVPMPPRPFFMEGVTVPLQDYVSTICLLTDAFSRLFAAARKIKASGARQALELTIAEELNVLKKTDQDKRAKPLNQTSKEVFQYIDTYLTLDDELSNLLNLDYLLETAPEQAEFNSEPLKMQPSVPDQAQAKAQRKPRKARSRSRP